MDVGYFKNFIGINTSKKHHKLVKTYLEKYFPEFNFIKIKITTPILPNIVYKEEYWRTNLIFEYNKLHLAIKCFNKLQQGCCHCSYRVGNIFVILPSNQIIKLDENTKISITTVN